MRKFSKILESAESDIVLDIRDILIDFKDAGFAIDIEEVQGTYTIKMKLDGKTDEMERIKDIVVADNRLRDLDLSYQSAMIAINTRQNPLIQNIFLVYKIADFSADKNVHGWKEFKGYCEKVLGIEGIEGADDFDLYFRMNVVDKDAGWPGLPDDKAGWSIGIEGIDPNTFAAAFPGYEGFIKKLLSRQINYNLVWHLVSDEGDRHHRISDPVKLAESNKNHNPMKFDKEGIEAVETLLEMANKFPDKIKINKSKI